MARWLNLRHIVEDSHFFGAKPKVKTEKREVRPNLVIRTDQFLLENGHRLIIISRGNPDYYSQRVVCLHYNGTEKPYAATTLDYFPQERRTTIDGALADVHPEELVIQKMLSYTNHLVRPTQPLPEHELDTSDSDIRGM